MDLQAVTPSRLLGAKFGPTSHNHKELMPLIWGPAANIALFLVLYNYRKIWSWIHGAFFSIANIITLSTSLPILFHTGFIQQNTTIVTRRSIAGLRLHYLVGIVCLVSMVLAATLGISTKVLNILEKQSSFLLLVRKCHKFCGYLTLILCKMNMYVITWGGDFSGFFMCDLVFAVLLVYWKTKFPRMQAKPIAFEIQTLYKSITSIKDLSPVNDYVVFSNLVYETSPLKLNHPGGFQIIKAVKNQEIDRYIYGSYTVDSLENIPLWSHSYKAFTLLGSPIAKLDIPSTFQGCGFKEIECQILSLKQLAEKGEIFMANIIKKQGKPFKFLKLTNVNQLGRYFSLRCNQKNTRLYTVLNFLIDQNTQFLSKYLRYPEFVTEQKISVIESEREFQPKHELYKSLKPEIINKTTRINDLRYIELCQRDEDVINKRRSSIPIIFKLYPGGKLTNQLLRNGSNTLHLSGPKGQGLRFGQIKPGKVLIVAGGTGLLPFSDLIDLLFKEQLIRMNPSVKEQVLRLNPILEDDPFAGYHFQMLASFNRVQEIHYVTFEQLMFLAQRGRMKITFKLKDKIKGKVQGGNISFTNRRFQDLLDSMLTYNNIFSKIMICGPPKMNQALSNLSKSNRFGADLYQFI